MFEKTGNNNLPATHHNFEIPLQRQPLPPGTIEVTETFSGPLPHPDLLRKYDSTMPGSAERIFRYVEQEAEHRRVLELTALGAEVDSGKRDSVEARRGQIFALTITLFSLTLGGVTALFGHEVAGSLIGISGVGGIVASFLSKREPSAGTTVPGTQK